MLPLVALLVLALSLAVPWPAQAQMPVVVAEQWLHGQNSNGFVSAALDPARRYGLQVLPVSEASSFRGTFTQNWFARDGNRRAGTSEGTWYGRAPWEQELPLPILGLSQWTLAAGFWNEGQGVLLVRLLDLGPRP